MKNKFLQILLAASMAAPSALSADTVILRNGRVFYNVVSVTNKHGYQLVFQNGRTVNVRRQDVKRIQIQTVNWKPQKIIEYREKPAVAEARPGPPVAAKSEPQNSSDDWRYASGLLPGLQQFRENRMRASGVFASAFLVSVATLADSRTLQLKARERLNFPLPIYSVLYLETANSDADAPTNNAPMLFAATYLPGLKRDLAFRRRNAENAGLATVTILMLNYLDAIQFSGISFFSRKKPADEPGFRFALLPTASSDPRSDRPGFGAHVQFSFFY